MDALPFESQVLQRLRDISTRLANVEAIVAERGRTFTRVLDGVFAGFRALGTGAGTLLERITNPSRNFIIFWVITVVGFTGLTVSEVVDIGKMASGLWSGKDAEEITPEPEPEPEDEP